MGNPFDTWWYQAAFAFNPLFRAFGYALVLRRCEWTRSKCRIAVAYVGWDEP